MSESEQNKTEEPTPFKLKKAREKGQVPRGVDLGFFAMLVGLCLYAVISGRKSASRLTHAARNTLADGMEAATEPAAALAAISNVYGPSILMLTLFGATIVLTVIVVEVVQLGGPAFSAHPLKPDFNRVNPGKGLKRVFSMKTLKDALKNIVKMTIYVTAAYLVIEAAVLRTLPVMTDAARLSDAMYASGLRLLIVFALLAVFFAGIDQVISRVEFTKQMRMSKSELKREVKDREGEPRMRQKRKELHTQFAQAAQGVRDLPGSDVLVVNPEHYAVGLAYDASSMSAPKVTAKGRNHFALHLKREAVRLSIPIVADPPLARALYRATSRGDEVSGTHYAGIAELYLKLARDRAGRPS